MKKLSLLWAAACLLSLLPAFTFAQTPGNVNLSRSKAEQVFRQTIDEVKVIADQISRNDRSPQQTSRRSPSSTQRPCADCPEQRRPEDRRDGGWSRNDRSDDRRSDRDWDDDDDDDRNRSDRNRGTSCPDRDDDRRGNNRDRDRDDDRWDNNRDRDKWKDRDDRAGRGRDDDRWDNNRGRRGQGQARGTRVNNPKRPTCPPPPPTCPPGQARNRRSW